MSDARISSPAIALALPLSLSSVTKELKRLGLNKIYIMPVARAASEHSRPGKIISLDLKKLGRLTVVGHSIIGARSPRKRGAGGEYLHVIAYTELLVDEKASTSTCSLIWAAGLLDKVWRDDQPGDD